MKIWSLPKHENLTTGDKILWKRGEISILFQNIFNISLTSRVQLRIYLLNVVVRIIFPQFCKSDMSRYGYLEVCRDKESRLYIMNNEQYLLDVKNRSLKSGELALPNR